MRRRKRRSSHSNHERWLVSYADFITLLFAFFVVLYASSQVDKKKVGKLAFAIQAAFQEMGSFKVLRQPCPSTSQIQCHSTALQLSKTWNVPQALAGLRLIPMLRSTQD